jgi:cyclase
VNTHYHPDHRGGNSVVGPQAIVIGTPFTLKQLAKNATMPPSSDKIAFDKQLTLYFGGHEINIYFPGPAHTMGDAVVYFPAEHTVATGDLFLTHSCPAMDQGDMENWISALDSILQLPVNSVVPGHFELASKDNLRRFRNYLADLRDQVASMFRAGASPEEIVKKLDLSKYKDFRQYPNYEATFADNAAAYYHQLQQRRSPQTPKSKQ